jgi:hypothetical protein
MMAPRKFVWITALALVMVLLPVSGDMHIAFASTLHQTGPDLPTGEGHFAYVYGIDGAPNNWNSTVTCCGSPPQQHLYAYALGYHASAVGSPPIYALAFGREFQSSNGNWGVQLPKDQATHSLTWVAKIANAFIKGYNDGHPNNSIIVTIGTNDDDYPWGPSDQHWWNAGWEWGHMISRDISGGSRVTVWSANDIEGYYYDHCYPNHPTCYWGSSGAGTIQWIYGLMAGAPGVPNYDFGDNARIEYPDQWSIQQLFQAAYSIAPENPIPQVYCIAVNGTPSNFYTRSWYTPIAYSGNAMMFYGVTSEDNSQSRTCGVGYGLTWQQSWTDFNNVLQTPEPGFLWNNAIGYVVPTPYR